MALRKFIIESDIPAVGTLDRQHSTPQVHACCHPDIQWQESYVADGKTFCVYLARDEAIIHRHAELRRPASPTPCCTISGFKMSGFSALKITEARRLIDPTTERACSSDSIGARHFSRAHELERN